MKTKFEFYLHLFLLADDCKDVQSEIWKSKNFEDKYGNLCEKYVVPMNLCDKRWRFCDYKKCKEVCKKTCNNCLPLIDRADFTLCPP